MSIIGARHREIPGRAASRAVRFQGRIRLVRELEIDHAHILGVHGEGDVRDNHKIKTVPGISMRCRSETKLAEGLRSSAHRRPVRIGIRIRDLDDFRRNGVMSRSCDGEILTCAAATDEDFALGRIVPVILRKFCIRLKPARGHGDIAEGTGADRERDGLPAETAIVIALQNRFQYEILFRAAENRQKTILTRGAEFSRDCRTAIEGAENDR